jgi:hypothetical protein
MSRKQKSGMSQPGASVRSGNNTCLVEKTVRRRKKVQLILTPGIPDQDGLRSVVREWLVPMLVQDFLRERGIERMSPNKANKNHKTNYGMPWQGARATTRVD